jgi:DNA-binding NtrC family response regulator
MRRLRALIRKVAPHDLAVLVTGESGAGKELVAESIHILSGRPGAFVVANVPAIADGTFESTLFGHVRGAFTNAVTGLTGLLKQADNGTILFDELGTMQMALQPKVLRALETRVYRPVGASQDERSNFRLVSATNECLETAVAEHRFRVDLFARVGGITIRVPPLRDHLEDIPYLVDHILSATSGGVGPRPSLTSEALDSLMRHSWPGNVRELRNVVQRAVILAGSAKIDASDIGDAIGSHHGGPRQRRVSVEASRVADALAETNGDVAAAAELLGTHRATMYRRIAALRGSRPSRGF